MWKAMSFLSNKKCHYADIENRYSKGTIPYINLVLKVNIVIQLTSWFLGADVAKWADLMALENVGWSLFDAKYQFLTHIDWATVTLWYSAT